jgi:hypothetical protein
MIFVRLFFGSFIFGSRLIRNNTMLGFPVPDSSRHAPRLFKRCNWKYVTKIVAIHWLSGSYSSACLRFLCCFAAHQVRVLQFICDMLFTLNDDLVEYSRDDRFDPDTMVCARWPLLARCGIAIGGSVTVTEIVT